VLILKIQILDRHVLGFRRGHAVVGSRKKVLC